MLLKHLTESSDSDVKQAYDDAMRHPAGSSARKAAIQQYQNARALARDDAKRIKRKMAAHNAQVRKNASLAAKNRVKEDANPKDTATFDIPLLIRLLEYAREDAKTDMDLHNVTEHIISLSASGETLTMDHYDAIVASESVDEDVMNPTVGNYDLSTLQRKVARDLSDASTTAKTANSRREWSNIAYQLDNNTMYQIKEIIGAYESLGAQRKKGGLKSRGIDADRVSEACTKKFKRK